MEQNPHKRTEQQATEGLFSYAIITVYIQFLITMLLIETILFINELTEWAIFPYILRNIKQQMLRGHFAMKKWVRKNKFSFCILCSGHVFIISGILHLCVISLSKEIANEKEAFGKFFF